MEREADGWLEQESVPPARRRRRRAFDMRYLGQNFELTVPEPPGPFGLEALRSAFGREHERVYGYAAADEPVQVVAFRLTALGEVEGVTFPTSPEAANPEPEEACIGQRPVYFDETGGFVATAVYRRERLSSGHRLLGPAVVEQMDSTTLILPGQQARVDAWANLLITV
jgi:N-methylhydantoinase A